MSSGQHQSLVPNPEPQSSAASTAIPLYNSLQETFQMKWTELLPENSPACLVQTRAVQAYKHKNSSTTAQKAQTWVIHQAHS